MANKIELFCADISAVSATLDGRTDGRCRMLTDGDELKNRFPILAPSELGF